MPPVLQERLQRADLQAPHAAGPGGRALVWDAQNTGSVLVARAFALRGWTVDWMGTPRSPWADSPWFNGTRTFVTGPGDAQIERLLYEHPLDALLLLGDDQVRWMLERWPQLPSAVRRHLPDAESLRIGVSKQLSAAYAATLDVPVLATVQVSSRSEVAAAGARLAPGGDVVVKGDGAAGTTVIALRAGREPSPDQWRTVTRHGPSVLVQRRIYGPRFLVTVAYERGAERAACVHEKVVAFPHRFGPAAFGVTRRVDVLHDYAQRLFHGLGWHGIADVEFRRDPGDGRWYFMEINPRVCATLGIQERAGLDVAGLWARVCEGEGEALPDARGYRDGVRYAWSVRALALALRRPWSLPVWGPPCLLSEASDFHLLDARLRQRALRLAYWMARTNGR